jgi:hypothetical protein
LTVSFLLFFLDHIQPHTCFIGVISILDAETNDLALLINTLDLQATPNTPDVTPLRPSPFPSEKLPGTPEYNGSPKKKAVVDSPLKMTL